jgi:hypothetical protein
MLPAKNRVPTKIPTIGTTNKRLSHVERFVLQCCDGVKMPKVFTNLHFSVGHKAFPAIRMDRN